MGLLAHGATTRGLVLTELTVRFSRVFKRRYFRSNSLMDEFVESEIQNYFRCNTPGTFHFCFEENDSSFLQSANFQCYRVLVTRNILNLSKGI